MIGRNRFLSVDASPLDSAANGSGVLGVYAAYGALSPMNLISGSCSSDNAADGGSSAIGTGRADQGVLGLDGTERVPRELGLCFVVGVGNCPYPPFGGVCAIFC